ncbi:hypothetical protein B0O79_2445 [Flavobacteriaceae bacterium MAR_2009_75]|nr:hypothetical protein B0O79_2445 [Flavobacteriaceae bacterium MAR_2009_75]
MKDIPKHLLLFVLLTYPIVSYLIFELTSMEPNYVLGFLFVIYLGYILFLAFEFNRKLIIPNYLIVFGLFTLYAIFGNMFVSDDLREEGIVKYLYSNPFLQTFFGLLVIENIQVDKKWIKFAQIALGLTLIIASVVSINQIVDPLFLTKETDFVQGLSYDRLTEYYSSNPTEKTGDVDRFFDGYRLSIFSYINEVSVGFDLIAIFSILLAIRLRNRFYSLVLILSSAAVGFLSSARWIMLNFFVVASQKFFLKNNVVLAILKFTLFGIILFAVLIAGINFTGINLNTFVQERLLADSAGTRLLAFEVFFKVFPDNPIFGTLGVDTEKMIRLLNGRSSQIHVGYLKLFYYYGLIGGIIYLSFLALLFKRMWKIGKSSNYWGGFFAFLAFAIANLTLVKFDLFHYGLLLAILFSNFFYGLNDNTLTNSTLRRSKTEIKQNGLLLRG